VIEEATVVLKHLFYKSDARRRLFGSIIVGVFLRVLRLLPLRLSVQIKEKSHYLGKLDYAGDTVWMTLDSISQTSRLNACEKEPETVQWIKNWIKEGDVFYDIGANVGAYSFVAYNVAHGNCTIYAFEPSFPNFSALNKNIIVNGCSERIIPFNVALSDRTQIQAFTVSTVPGDAMNYLATQRFVQTPPASHSNRIRTHVITYRLDDFVQQFGLRTPNHIKLDVDGAEYSVLKGSLKILRSNQLRTILAEIDENNPEAGRILDLLSNESFEVLSRHQHGKSSVANYIFMRRFKDQP
jgi:FkbM family methyltransferase